MISHNFTVFQTPLFTAVYSLDPLSLIPYDCTWMHWEAPNSFPKMAKGVQMAERYRTQAYFDRLSLPTGETDKTFYDDKVTGLGLRFRAEGKPKWTLYYQRQGSQRRYVIGPRSVKLEAAREAAQLLQADIAKQIDIAQVRKNERKKVEQDTFGQAVEKYLEARKKGVWPPDRPAPRETTYDEMERYLNGAKAESEGGSRQGYFRPLHRTPVANISRDDIKKRLDEIARDNGAVAAARARTTLSTFFAWAIDAGQCETNPVTNITKQGEREPRSRTLAFDEIAKIYGAAGGLGDYGKIARLLFLTLCRRDEIGELEWTELDKEADAIVLPGARTKNKLEHLVPLSPLAQEIVTGITRRPDYPHVFGVRKDKPFSGWSKAKGELDEESGVDDWTLHDIRRSAGVLERIGIPEFVVEALLNHKRAKLSRTYKAPDLYKLAPEKREALNIWALCIKLLCEPKGPALLSAIIRKEEDEADPARKMMPLRYRIQSAIQAKLTGESSNVVSLRA
jgi:integrase